MGFGLHPVVVAKVQRSGSSQKPNKDMVSGLLLRKFIWGVSKIRDPVLEVFIVKDHTITASILGPPVLRNPHISILW